MSPDPGTLSVVIPVYDEPEWIGRTVGAAGDALRRSGFREPEIVVVDDGSGPATRSALDRLESAVPVQVLHQPNRGRFLARKAGLEAAHGDSVLLLDSRVLLDVDGLGWVADRVARGERVWNGHCMIDVSAGPYARFWDVLTGAAFADYLAQPRTTSFGPAEYDRFPKGTGHFLAPRALLLDAVDAMASHFEDLRFVSDDSHMLRHVVERERIHISPAFPSVYHARTALRPFLRQARYRGTTFVDTWRPGTRFFPLLVAVLLGSVLAPVLAARRPRLSASAALVPVAAAAVARGRWRRPWGDVLPFAALALPFGASFVAGLWRGVWLAVRGRGAA